MVFDANFHVKFDPTVPPHETLRLWQSTLTNSGVERALSVDLPGLNDHLSPLEFVGVHAGDPYFVPVPCLRSEVSGVGFAQQLEALHLAGVKTVKVHPRWLGIALDSDSLRDIVMRIRELGMRMLLCAYPYIRSNVPRGVQHVPTCLEKLAGGGGLPPTILMHGGGPQFLDVCEWARHQEAVFVDLSLTITQFRTSSVWLDMKNTLERFEQRLVLGSDAPFESLATWQSAYTRLLEECDPGTRHLVSCGNLQRFLASERSE